MREPPTTNNKNQHRKSLPPLTHGCWFFVGCRYTWQSRSLLGKGKKYRETSDKCTPHTKTIQKLCQQQKKTCSWFQQAHCVCPFHHQPATCEKTFHRNHFCPLRWQLCSGSWWTPLSQVKGVPVCHTNRNKSVNGILLCNSRSWPFPKENEGKEMLEDQLCKTLGMIFVADWRFAGYLFPALLFKGFIAIYSISYIQWDWSLQCFFCGVGIKS